MTDERISRIPAPVVPGISDSVRVSAGELLFVSGVIGTDADGSIPSDFASAVQLTFRELGRALDAGGATFSDVVRINVYIAGLDEEKLQTFRRVRDQVIDPDNLPASSLIGVASLVYGAAIEIDAIAAV